MSKPADLTWKQYMTKAFAEDRSWGTEHHGNLAVEALLDATCARLAKARLEAPGPRLMLPKVVRVAGSKVTAKASTTGFSRTRSSAEVQQAIARRMAMR
ncbi:hypothetical protein ACSFA2_00625 [Variovorax sp. LT2P21]|uniref:hypothetical protein n=1 Tax=Variovorax sp. LT2P21 TaxID=3443731 RepID=UPI003F484530